MANDEKSWTSKTAKPARIEIHSLQEWEDLRMFQAKMRVDNDRMIRVELYNQPALIDRLKVILDRSGIHYRDNTKEYYTFEIYEFASVVALARAGLQFAGSNILLNTGPLEVERVKQIDS